MIASKGKHHFWSQLLISMIAIFALPAAQSPEYPNDLRSENHQSQAQQIQHQMLTAAALIRHAGQFRQPLTTQSAVESAKLFKIEPHFFSAVFASHAPIRGSPSV